MIILSLFVTWWNNYLRMVTMRQAAGWEFHPLIGWISPDGDTAEDWAAEELPFPEDKGFAEWFTTYYHYEALDADEDCIPYPNAPAPTGQSPCPPPRSSPPHKPEPCKPFGTMDAFPVTPQVRSHVAYSIVT